MIQTHKQFYQIRWLVPPLRTSIATVDTLIISNLFWYKIKLRLSKELQGIKQAI